MPDYQVTLCRSARKELEKLDAGTLNRIFPKIEALANAPHPQGCLKRGSRTYGVFALVIIALFMLWMS